MQPVLVRIEKNIRLLVGTVAESEIGPVEVHLWQNGLFTLWEKHHQARLSPVDTIARLEVDRPSEPFAFPLLVSAHHPQGDRSTWVCQLAYARRARFGGTFDVQKYSGSPFAPLTRLVGRADSRPAAINEYVKLIREHWSGPGWEIIPLIVAGANEGRPGPRLMERALSTFLKTGKLPPLTTEHTHYRER